MRTEHSLSAARIFSKVAILAVMLSPAMSTAAPGDWPQWRGADRTGVNSNCPALADSWPANGQVKLWESEKIPAGGDGGYGTPSVADGCVYLFVSWKYEVPIATRRLTSQALGKLGWSDKKMPADLKKMVEDARTSDERANLKGDQVGQWVKSWLETRITEDQRKEFAGVVQDRLKRGKSAISLEMLDLLAGIKDKEFSSQAELDKWYQDNGVDEGTKKVMEGVIPASVKKCRDVILCIDAGNGKTLWRKQSEYTKGSETSSSVCVSDGKCYVIGIDGVVYCLNAKTGDEIWKAQGKEGCSSSAIVVDGMVIIQADPLMAFDAENGTVLWTQPKVRNNTSSPAVWRRDGKTYLICNTMDNVSCVDPKTGNVLGLWKTSGRGHSSPAIEGDFMVLLTSKADTGMVCYRMSVEKAEKVWNVGVADRGGSPVVYNGYAYAHGAGRVVCARLDTGAVAWDQEVGGGEIASPIVADGKLFVGGGFIVMISASPEKFSQLGSFKVGMQSLVSPCIANGKLFARTPNGIVCYDLSKNK